MQKCGFDFWITLPKSTAIHKNTRGRFHCLLIFILYCIQATEYKYDINRYIMINIVFLLIGSIIVRSNAGM